MMDIREKLVGLLITLLECEIDGDCSYLATGWADHLIANGVTVQEWISVNDKLPEDGESVLTYKNGNVDVQVYEKNRNGWIQGNWFWSMATVTHWMPLPEPYKGEQK